MSRKTVRKLIITIVLIILLVIVFIFNYVYKKYRRTNNVSMIKQIINEKYDKVDYSLDNNYIYAMNNSDGKYYYDVFDLNGNKEESFSSDKELNLVALSEYYYIVQDDSMYYLYNYDNELITYSRNMRRLNDELILVGNNIINYSGDSLYSNVDNVDSYHKDSFFNINDELFIDDDGDLVYDNCKVMEDVENTFITNYLILKINDNYYTFFTTVKNILGDGFDSYYIDDDEVSIYIDNDRYLIYNTGFRKKVSTFTINNKDNKYFYETKNRINNDYMIVNNREEKNYGIYSIFDGKYYPLTKKYTGYKRINKDYYLVQGTYENVVFGIKEKKIIYSSTYDLSNIVYYEDNSKVIKINDNYVLFDENDNEVLRSNKQIILENKKVLFGLFDEDVVVYNSMFIDGKTVLINGEYYVKYEKENEKIIQNLSSLKKYTSKDYVETINDHIILKDGSIVKFYDIYNNSESEYELSENEDIISLPFKDIIITKYKNDIEFINFKGKNIKEIEEKDVKEIIYNEKNNKIVVITYIKSNNSVKEGSYVCE